jgi:hypothetical protein
LDLKDGSLHGKKRDRNALALRFGHSRLSTKLRLSITLGIDHTTSTRIKRHQTPPLPGKAGFLVI